MSGAFSPWVGAFVGDVRRFEAAREGADYRGLIRGICEEPAADLPRLVLADWLEEWGWPAVEKYRLQLERPLQPDVPLMGFNLCKSVGNIIAAGRNAVLGSSVMPSESFRRGFVWRLRLDAAVFCRHAAELFAWHPIEEVRIAGKVPQPSQDNGMVGDRFWNAWVSPLEDSYLSALNSNLLPRMLFDRLGYDSLTVVSGGMLVKSYPSAAAALADLDRAAVAAGRHAAGLTPNPPDPTTPEK